MINFEQIIFVLTDYELKVVENNEMVFVGLGKEVGRGLNNKFVKKN
jgi:hypothetical protein